MSDRVRWNRAGVVLSAIVLAIVLVATLTPAPAATTTSDFWCVACGEFGGLDVLNNIVMFMPLGFAFLLASGARWRSVLACIAVTLFVESMQIKIVPGRDASLSDLLANSLGGVIGAELALRRRLLFRPEGRAASMLTIAGAALFALITSLTSLGLKPAEIPRSLWVQWTPDRASFDPFTGQLLDFKLDTIDLPRRFYPPVSLGVDRVLRGPSWRATATITTVGLRPERSVIARIAEEFTVLVSLEQWGWDLACHQKTRSGDFRFRSPKVGVADALSASTGAAAQRVRFTCAREGATLVAATEDRQEVLRLSPSLGWLLLCPFNIVMTSQLTWLGALWLFALAFPAGYWLRHTGRRGTRDEREGAGSRHRLTALAVVMASLVVGLALAPILVGSATAAWWEWVGAVLGVAAGSFTAWLVSTVEARWPTRERGPAVAPVSDIPR